MLIFKQDPEAQLEKIKKKITIKENERDHCYDEITHLQDYYMDNPDASSVKVSNRIDAFTDKREQLAREIDILQTKAIKLEQKIAQKEDTIDIER